MTKNMKIGLAAAAFGLLLYLVKSGKLTLPAIGTSLTTVNPNWPKDTSGNALTPGTLVNPDATHPYGGVVNMYGYVV